MANTPDDPSVVPEQYELAQDDGARAVMTYFEGFLEFEAAKKIAGHVINMLDAGGWLKPIFHCEHVDVPTGIACRRWALPYDINNRCDEHQF